MSRRIAIHIDRIAIDAAQADRPEAIAAAIERELARRLALPGATATIATGSIERIDGGRIAGRDIGTALGARIGAILTHGGQE